jgi:hypothetical protein
MADKYEVGYRKPPRHTRFRKGQSGNPKGRCKGSKNLKTDLQEELAEHISIREAGGRSRSVTKQRALLKRLFADALRGEKAASSQVMTLILRVLGPEAVSEMADPPLNPEEEQVLAFILSRTASDPDECKGDG